MRRKWMLGLMASVMLMAFAGCSMGNPLGKEAATEGTGEHPVLGQENIDGYEGFTYLYDEVLMTAAEQNEETGEMEESKLTVYVPMNDNTYLSQNTVSASKFGVKLSVKLEPDMQIDQKNCRPKEKLGAYMESSYDPFYTTEYRDLVVSKAKKVGKNAARATAEYCLHDDYDDCYETIFVTCYYTELDNGQKIFVETMVYADDVTGKTPELIEELEKFYQFDIDWDADRAAQKKRII